MVLLGLKFATAASFGAVCADASHVELWMVWRGFGRFVGHLNGRREIGRQVVGELYGGRAVLKGLEKLCRDRAS